MPIVEIQGQQIQFPDDMSQQKIDAIIQRDFGEAPALTQMGESAAEDDVLGVSTAGMQVPTEEGRTQAVRQFAKGATFGYADEMEALMRSLGGADYDQELAKIRGGMMRFEEEKPTSALSAELVGALYNPSTLAKLPGLIAKMSPTAQATVKGLIGGAAYGSGTADGDLGERIEKGAIMSVPTALFGGGTQIILNKLANKTANKAIEISKDNPTVETLKKAKNQAYKVVDESQAVFTPNDRLRVLGAAQKEAAEVGYVAPIEKLDKSPTHPILAKSFSVLRNLKDQSLSLKQMENTRRLLQENTSQAFRGGAKDEYRAIKGIIADIDDMVEQKLAAEGSDSLMAARVAHQRYSKVRDINEALAEAKIQAQTSGTGGNVENLYRQAINRILKKRDVNKYYTQEEQDLMRKFAQGNMPRNLYRLIGKLSPTDSGLMTALQLGAYAADPSFAFSAASGFLSKKLGQKATEQEAGKLLQVLGDLPAPPSIASQPGITALQSVATGGLIDNIAP